MPSTTEAEVFSTKVKIRTNFGVPGSRVPLKPFPSKFMVARLIYCWLASSLEKKIAAKLKPRRCKVPARFVFGRVLIGNAFFGISKHCWFNAPGISRTFFLYWTWKLENLRMPGTCAWTIGSTYCPLGRGMKEDQSTNTHLLLKHGGKIKEL